MDAMVKQLPFFLGDPHDLQCNLQWLRADEIPDDAEAVGGGRHPGLQPRRL